MMKSFFKKLAFVMALAMVVTTAAPAANVFAAEFGIVAQDDKTWTIVETANVEVDEKADFKFVGAPSNWASLGFTWTSSDEDVATVNQAGVVTGVADGVAVITLADKAGAYVATLEVTVGEGEVVVDLDAFEVKQLSLNTVKLTFADTKEVKVDDVILGTLYGDQYIEQPVKAVNVNKNEVYVTLYTNLINKGQYAITVGEETVAFTASAGEIYNVAFEYWTDRYGDGNAFVPENESDTTVTTLVHHFYDVAGVDVTALYPDVDVAYELMDDNTAVDLLENTVTFTEPTVAQIMLTVSWLDTEGEDVVKEYPGFVVAKNRPALAFTVLGAGVFKATDWEADPEGALAEFLYDGDGFIWSKNKVHTEFIDGDTYEDLRFGAALKDNRGNIIATGFGDDNYYGHFVMETTNDNVIAVEEDGSLTVVGEGVANVIISFVPSDAEDEEAEKVYVTYQKLVVKPARYATSYKIASTSKKAVTDGSAKTGSFVLGVFDQYGDLIDLENGVADIVVEATSTKNEVELGVSRSYGWNSSFSKYGPSYTISYNGANYKTMLGTAKNATYKYKVSIDKDENETITTGNSSLSLVVYNTATYYGKLFAEDNKTFEYKPSINKTSVDVVVNNIANYNYTNNSAAQKSVTVSAKYIDPTSKLNLATVYNMTELEEDQTTGEVGTIYYSVVAPKGVEDDNWGYTTTATGSNIVLTFNTITEGDDDNDGFAYATTGTYKVILKYANKTNNALKTLETYNINVKNSQPDAAFVKFNPDLGNETETNILAAWNEDADGDEVKDGLDEVIALINENMIFNFTGCEIIDVNFKAYSSKVYIKKVTFRVLLDDADEDTAYAVEKSVTVNKYIYEAEEEE